MRSRGYKYMCKSQKHWIPDQVGDDKKRERQDKDIGSPDQSLSSTPLVGDRGANR